MIPKPDARPSAQLVVSMLLIALFGYAYFSNPDDEMMKGALIAAFAAAYSYFLGSSTGSKASGDVVRRIAEQPAITATGDNPVINAPGSAPETTDDPAMYGGPRP